jgi:tetratricopeptide (TPR) repeat protein
MYCQACGVLNDANQEFCTRCQQKLLVVSGKTAPEDEAFEGPSEEQYSLDEHLLERISIAEEAVKRTTDAIRKLHAALGKQERNILINQTGLATMRELLEGKRLVARHEWAELWEAKMNYQMLALEKRERFGGLKARIAALYQGEKKPAFERLLDDAEFALFAFDIERAIGFLEAAYKLDTANYELAYFIGETHFNEGEPDRALEYFTNVLAAAPDHYEGLVYSGVIHHERGEGSRAEKLLKRAVGLYPESFLPHFSLGAMYAGKGQLALATVLLEKAVAIEPVPQALYLLGSCLYEMGKLGPSIRYLQEVVRYDPAFEDAYHLLGLAYLDRHWTRKALEAFRQAQRLNPSKMRYQDFVGYLSGTAASPLPEVDSEAREWLLKAEDYLGRDNADRAVVCFRKAITLDPDNPTLLLSFALACLQLNRHRETESLSQQVLNLEPNEMLKATAYATLIESLRSEGRLREGNRVGRRFLDEGESSFSQTIAYYQMACNLAEMEEDLDRALRYAHKALELSPEELRQFPLAAVGWVHYKRKEYEEAVDFLSRSSDLGTSAASLTHLGMALLASGSEELARSTLAQARELEGTGGSLEQKMMECLKDSRQLMARVAERRRKPSD